MIERQYYNPRLQLLLCRRRLNTDWQSTASFKAPFWRFYWHSDAPARIKLNEKNYTLSPEVCALIAPETDFQANELNPHEQFYIHFQAGHPYDSCTPGIYTFTLTDSIKDKIYKISKLLKTEETKPSRKLSLLLLSLCHESLLNIPENTLSEDFTSQRIIKTLDHIDRHFAEPLSNDLLADKAGMNTNAFIRFFKQHTGKPPQKVIQERRIREACILLRYSNRSIDEIAQTTGFADRYYFSRMFQKNRGTGPAEFRKSIQ